MNESDWHSRNQLFYRLKSIFHLTLLRFRTFHIKGWVLWTKCHSPIWDNWNELPKKVRRSPFFYFVAKINRKNTLKNLDFFFLASIAIFHSNFCPQKRDFKLKKQKQKTASGKTVGRPVKEFFFSFLA